MIWKLFDPRAPKETDAPIGKDLSEANRMLRVVWKDRYQFVYGLRLMRFIWLIALIIAIIGWCI